MLVQDLILRRFGVEYHPHYIYELLDQQGFSCQNARFASDHLNAVDKTLHQFEHLPSKILSLMGFYCDSLSAQV